MPGFIKRNALRCKCCKQRDIDAQMFSEKAVRVCPACDVPAADLTISQLGGLPGA